MNDLKDLITIDELEQMNTICCPFCYSARLYPVVGKNVKINNRYAPYQEVKIPSVNGFYCINCETAYVADPDLTDVIQQCKDISGDQNFYPELGEENINV